MSILNRLPDSETIALNDLKQTMTYSEFKNQVRKKIDRHPIQTGSIVWVPCTNSINTLLDYFYCWEQGACIIPIDPQLGTSEIAHLYKRIPPHFILESRDETNAAFLLLKALKSTLEINADIKDAALIQMSSGTTGAPKLILLSLEALIFRANSYLKELNLSVSDRTLATVPLSHSHGIDCLALPTLFAGGTLFLAEPKSALPYRILKWIEAHQITYFSSLPQMYQFFNQLASTQKFDLSSLRHAFCGSAALSEETALQFKEYFDLDLKQGYGLAEIGVICANFGGEVFRYHSIGQPIPGIQWSVASDGELMVKSKALFSGYYQDELETSQRLKDGFLCTEDLVSTDELGQMYIVGRKNEFINVAGNKVYPREIERQLEGVSGLSEICVTSIADAVRGQLPVLHILDSQGNVDHAELERKILEHLHGRLEDFKIPRVFKWHSQFPKSPLGKILKSKL